ncbi:MAG: pirin family protein [Myxococcota bacterium]
MSEVSRRQTLGMVAAAGATATTACGRTSREQARSSAAGSSEAEPSGAAPSLSSAVLAVAPLGASPPWKTRDPFLFCVHHLDAYPRGNAQFGPEASLAGRQLGMDFAGRDGWRMYHGQTVPGFPQHPHRGFETVTVVRRGLLDHADSLGAAARYGEGDVQWLTAGRGILHAEMFPLLRRDEDNPVELFQIWLNLPAADKMVAPSFEMLWAPTIPRVVARDAQGRKVEVVVQAGAYQGHRAPSPPPHSYASRPEADVAIWTVAFESGARWTLPAAQAGTDRTLYFWRGAEMTVDGRRVAAKHQIEVRGDAEVALVNGDAPAEVLLLQGRPIGEPVARHGPFVMNSPTEVQQAFADYRRTQFGGWPWDRDDPVHGPERDRFARRPDGRVERPA